MYVNRQRAFFSFYIVKLLNLRVCVLVSLIAMQENKVVWFAGFLSCFGVLFSQKVGVSFQKDFVFCLEKRSFSTTNSSFSRNKTPFSVLKYGVLFSSIAKIFASTWEVIIYHYLLFSQNFQSGHSSLVSGPALELVKLKIVNQNLRKILKW